MLKTTKAGSIIENVKDKKLSVKKTTTHPNISASIGHKIKIKPTLLKHVFSFIKLNNFINYLK
ncbi:hypothetical protein [Algibacter sp. PT7-4]|uniref:hypothetical protein n=1 Tax=Algibacter ulvanivorans TaxID=3400999 RepID=UPI003AAE6CB2